MRSNYKRIGPYIQVVDTRNTEGETDNLLGVSVSKCFMPSIANTVGTDFKKYKVVKRNQFTYIPDTSRRGDKIGVALLEDYDEALVSQAYTVFEITNKELLDPEYLMMWFRRPEFDRYARFKSHGSVREIFDWDEMCNVELPIPSIKKQREIVAEYNTVKNRIALNNQLIQKLEETAQAIYKRWFVDFEFPDDNGKPYQSSGGKMVYDEDLDKEIPDGWTCKRLSDISVVKAGGDKPKIYSIDETDECKVPIYSNSSVKEGLFGFTNSATVFDESITISARGAIIGYTVLRKKPFVPIVRLIVVIPAHDYLLNYTFYCVKDFKYDDSGSAQGQLTVPDISSFKVISPSSCELKEFQKMTTEITRNIDIKRNGNEKLETLRNILLSKLATIEN